MQELYFQGVEDMSAIRESFSKNVLALKYQEYYQVDKIESLVKPFKDLMFSILYENIYFDGLMKYQ